MSGTGSTVRVLCSYWLAMMSVLVYLVLALCLSSHVMVMTYSASCVNVICYYNGKAFFRSGLGKVEPENISPSVCTNIHFYRALVKRGKIQTETLDYLDTSDKQGLYSRLTSLKVKKPGLKVLLTVGTWATRRREFDSIVLSDNSMRLFCDNLIQYLRKHRFDGVEIAWLITDRQSSSRLIVLSEILKESFSAESSRTGSSQLLLAVSVEGDVTTTNSLIRKDRLIKFADYVVINTKTYHKSWEMTTGLTAPLYPQFEGDTKCVKWTLDQWLKPGTNTEKLFMALSTRGSLFTLKDPSLSVVGAPATHGKFGGNKWTCCLTYYQICSLMKSQGKGPAIIDRQGGAYTVLNNDQWVGYENNVTIAEKAAFSKQRSLGGVAMYFVDWDDPRGAFCDQGPFPLTSILNACPFMGNRKSYTR